MDVRRVGPDDWADLRAVRLRALADAPGAFLTTLADAERRTDAEWRRQAVERVQFLAHVDGEAAGMVGVFVVDHDPGTVEVVGMWTAPAHRGTGVGAALVDAAAEWARSAGARRLALWVMRTNEGATAFYRRIGFVETHDAAVRADDPCRAERRMVRTLS